MAVTHIAAFTWVEGTDDATVAAIDEALHAMAATREGLEGMQTFRCGRDLGLVPNTADFGAIGVFTDREAYERYRTHPEHRRIVEELVTPNAASRTVTQFED